MLPRVEYLHWIQGRPAKAAHDLATSDLRVDRPGPGQVVPSALDGLDDPAPDVTLDAQVAAAHSVAESEVVITAGATHAYVLAVAAALAKNGDHVLVERPGYEPLWRTPKLFGGEVRRYRRPRADGYELAPGRVVSATDEDTALVVATNRHNPSGRLVDRRTLATATAVVMADDARLLVDEVYAPYTATVTAGAFGGPTAAGLDGTVAIGSLTKFHGLSGLRVGWVVADRPFIERVEQAAAHLPVVSEPGAALARRALANHERLAADARERLRANHERLAAFVDDRPDVSGRVFDGSPFAFLAHESADGDAVADAAWERDLLVVPGRFFEADDRFRVGLGGDPGEMAAALDVLGETLDALD